MWLFSAWVLLVSVSTTRNTLAPVTRAVVSGVYSASGSVLSLCQKALYLDLGLTVDTLVQVVKNQLVSFHRWDWFLFAFAHDFEMSVAEDLNFPRRCFCSLDKITRNCLTMPISAFYFNQTHRLLPPSNFSLCFYSHQKFFPSVSLPLSLSLTVSPPSPPKQKT